MKSKINRRSFIKLTSLASGSLAFGFEEFLGTKLDKAALKNFQPNRFLVFQTDGFIKVFSGRTEMGQGTNTNIRHLVAEELCIAPEKIKLTIQSPYNGFFVGTGGSWGIAGYHRSARPLFATARQAFVNAAARHWKVNPKDCFVQEGQVVYRNGNQRAAYHELLDIVSKEDIPEKAKMIPSKQYKYLGKSRPMDHLEEQLNGKVKYGIDQYVEGMIYASIERCPFVGGRLKNLKANDALKLEGVLDVIPIAGTNWNAYDYYPAGVAVIADNSWSAQVARNYLIIEWEKDEYNGEKIDNDFIQQVFDQKLKLKATTVKHTNGFDLTWESADETIEAIYETPFWSHSPMETMNTIAHFKEDHCEFWCPCHMQTRLLEATKKITGFKDEQIKINTPYVGGSFGRRLIVDYALEALQLSMELQAPVQVLYSRIDETKFDHFMSGGKYLMKAAIKDNWPIAISTRIAQLSVWSQREPQLLKNGIDSSLIDDYMRYPYEIDQVNLEHHLVDEIRIPVLWWRGTFANSTGFFMESWIDELAFKCKKDPLDFRLKLLKNDTKPIKLDEELSLDKKLYKRVLTEAARLAAWDNKRKKGFGKGISACYTFFDSYAAMVAAVQVKKNILSIKKITCVVDCGQVLNPNMVKAQLESGIIFSLSAMMKSSINFENGKVKENSYRDYPILKYDECPEMEFKLLPSDRPVSGVGELSNIVTFAAVCNAIFDATGKRIRSLPLSMHLNVS